MTRRDLLRAVLPGLVVSGLAVWAFAGLLDALLEQEDLYVVDQPLVDWLASHRTEWLTTTLTAITNAFGPVILPIVVGVVCAIWGARSRQWRDPLLLAGAMVLSTLIAMIVKAIIERPRPDESLQVIPGLETSFSFPSGHTTGAATLVLVLGYLVLRRRHPRKSLVAWAVLSVVVIVLVGGSRLYLGYHFFTDVLAGASLGVFTLGLVASVDRWLDLRERAAREADGAAQR
ncbi:phosphatase PAP2 family protein [Demequina zhanjiangensis]|uniref:Phosphatase PAP2 family protein n=1 Tax=Demequina zhanjiangensis TaxID=3051659 RepID=A0ABT8FZ02_9MICO|nr:phosphatase PAP2 family protein [Demequina sp. SYSU T00b26]MDN4472121.1 phosphatase PAP2 family protein [Demequina sp. SYSU T00b26]